MRAPNGAAVAWIFEHLSFSGDECLIWPFRRGETGYGRVRWEGKQRNVSRIVCGLVNGEPPSPEHQAAHSCGNGRGGCANPKHLTWKTPQENQADRLVHGTLFPTRPRHNTSGVAGVGWHKKSKMWRAYISEQDKHKSLGFFGSFEEAVAARQNEVNKRMLVAYGEE